MNAKDTFLFAPDKPSGPLAGRQRRVLFLPAFLKDEAQKRGHLFREELERAHPIFVKWADLAQKSYLSKKETALDADFLREIFGEALGYALVTEESPRYQLERQYAIPGGGFADGALGDFEREARKTPAAVIELKSADVNLDLDRFNGRTPIQQCWDYLNALPECTWGIVSNFISFRLYHQNHGVRAFENFALQELRNPERFREFYYVFGQGGLLPTKVDPVPRAERLLRMSGERQRAVGDELYDAYSAHRLDLIAHLHAEYGKTLDQAIGIAQKLLDRIIFVAFCEDRGLLPGKTIERTFRDIPPMARVTNPRWRNFVNLFIAVDKGHKDLSLIEGYNGGLFQHDPDVDELDLGDEWTNFFQSVGRYDFRDEVNVDVLGHLFEKSVTELERIKAGGLFTGQANGADAPPKMPKSAERKRFGVFYTPPEFTSFIVEQAVGGVVRQRFEALAEKHGVKPDAPEECRDAEILRNYYADCLAALRNVKICDPACGSGAFLIAAYDYLEGTYADVVSNLDFNGGNGNRRLAEDVPDIILTENLFGVDLSPEAVEITRLALWIRSARRERTLADLSRNVVCGNSLVEDSAAHPRAMTWAEVFRQVFDRAEGGFDCVIGNPPWERLKVQEREFFSLSAPEIAEAVRADKRRKLIADLERRNPELYQRYVEAQNSAAAVLDYARQSGSYPLTGQGDINTYMLFAELARKIVSPSGRVGLLVPSGIATDITTKEFFAALMESKALISLHDFENRKKIFPDVDNRFKFCTLVFSGGEERHASADFVFFAHSMRDLEQRRRHIPLSAKDMRLVNPNTGTCPIFRSRRDAELTKAIYKRVPVLIDRNRKTGGNPWGVRFIRMFDQTNDAELFHNPEELDKKGYKLKGNRWTRGKHVYLPLYEAKMVQAYDHRAAGVLIERGNWVRQGQTEPTTLVAHQNPEFVVQPRWWVDEVEVTKSLGERLPAYLAYKDVTSPTNERTMIAAFIPFVAVVNSAPLILFGQTIDWRTRCCLLANFNCFAMDFIARQKVGGVHLNFFIVEQLPIFPPDRYAQRCPWDERRTLERWISERVLKLTCTAEDMLPLAEAAGFKPGVHKWNPEERARLRAELDAAYFRLYGLDRDDAEYVLSTFAGTRRRDESETGKYRTAELILEAYDSLQTP